MIEDEKRIVRRFLSSEQGGFESLYDLYGLRIYRFCQRLCRNPSDAEDLTQEVFLAAYVGLHKFQGRSSIATWLYRVALFRWRRTSGAPSPHLISMEDASEKDMMSPDTASGELNRWELERAISRLPDSLREAFLLIKVEGLTSREAAEVLEIPQCTVKFRVHQAIVRLQKELQLIESECREVTGNEKGDGNRGVMAFLPGGVQ